MKSGEQAYQEARELANKQRYKEALAKFREASAADPSWMNPVFGIGLMHQYLQEHVHAIDAFSTAITACATNPHAFYSRALSLQHLHRHEEAITDLEKAIEVGLGDSLYEAKYAKAVSLKYLYWLDESIICYSSVIESNPDHYQAHHGRGTVNHMLGNWEASVVDLSNYLKLMPRESPPGTELPSEHEVLGLRGGALLQLGKPDEALLDFERAILLNPMCGPLHIRKFQALKALGRDEEASKVVERSKVFFYNQEDIDGVPWDREPDAD